MMEKAGQAAENAREHRWDVVKELASAMRVLLIPLVIVFYIAILLHNLSESDRRSLLLQQDSDATDKVHVSLKVVSVDVARAEFTARMQISLAGKIAKDEFTPAVNLRFLVNAVSGQQRFEFQRGDRVTPAEVVFAIAGEPNLYPFDRYQASLAFLASKPGQAAKPPPPPAPAKSPSFFQRLTKSGEKDTAAKAPAAEALIGKSELASHAPVPISFELSASIPGFKFEGEIAKNAQEEDVTRIQMNLRRSDNVIVTSLGIQLMMLCLALSMLAMVLYGTIQGKESALAPLSISAALIFGLPALRDTQPGVPPLGGFSDYVSYLWAESIVAISTVIAIWTWIARHRSKSAEQVTDPAIAGQTLKSP